MLSLKNCPRCRGDLHSNRDIYGPYVECLQCGYMDNNVQEKSPAPRARKRAKKPAAA